MAIYNRERVSKLIFKSCLLFLIIVLMIYIYKNMDDIMYKLTPVESLKEIYGNPINEETGTINNAYFNINSNGEEAENTTKGINRAIEYASKNGIKNIKLEKGTYLIYGEGEFYEKRGVVLQSNISLDLNGSTIKHRTTSEARYTIMSLYEVENVKIYNGIILGDKDTHDYSSGGTHEFGYGIEMRGAHNVEIDNLEITGLTGDGMLISEMTRTYSVNKQKNQSRDVEIKNCNIYGNRRQGISLIDVADIEIHDNEIHDIEGTPPSAGIDMECNLTTEQIENAKVYRNKFYNFQKTYAIVANRGTKTTEIYENDVKGMVSVASVSDKAIVRDNYIAEIGFKSDLTGWNSNAGYTLNKVVLQNNFIDNGYVFINKANDVLISGNKLNSERFYIVCSNGAVYNNTFEQKTIQIIRNMIFIMQIILQKNKKLLSQS